MRFVRLWWVLVAAIPALSALCISAVLVPHAWENRGPLPDLQTSLYWGTLAMGVVAIAVLVWRVTLVARYRPHSMLADESLPVVTVVIPAYNEGAQVAATIRSVLASDYPLNKLKIVAVDDGSRDDTWAWIQAAQAEDPTRVTAIHYRQNQGKRYALNRGFLLSEGSVIVTVDSDSEVAVDTLRNLASPFADARVGGVAGNVRVLNKQQAIIPRMLDVAFTYSFEFVRASQSMVKSVFCTPGALSAYRRDIVMSVREQWLAQTFMSRPASIGEDRAMTNLILKHGYHVVFQSNAVVYTEVPERLPQLSRMLLRWARSNIRESLVTASFIFGPFRATPMWASRCMFIFDTLSLVVLTTVAVPALALTFVQPLGPLWVMVAVIVGSLPSATVYALLRGPRSALWAFAYGFYALVALSWIKPYAALTLWKNGWLTRGVAVPSAR